jgi:hypothetical protein
MFIDRRTYPSLTPFGGAELNESFANADPFRSSERSRKGAAPSSINMSPLAG